MTDSVDAWRALLLAHNRALRAIDAELDRAGSIPLPWYDVLLELNAAPERRLRMQELADRVVLSRTRVSRLVDDMARADLVAKSQDDTDRRSVWATITGTGIRELRKTSPKYLRGIEKHFASHLTDEEKEIIATALGRVHSAHTDGHSQPITIARPRR